MGRMGKTFGRPRSEDGASPVRGPESGDLSPYLSAFLWQADPETLRVTFVSAGAGGVVGYPVGRWLSDPGIWEAIVHPEDLERVLGALRAAVAGARDAEIIHRAVAADGREILLRNAVRVVRHAQGGAVRLWGMMIEVTAGRAAAPEVPAPPRQSARLRGAALLAAAVAALAGIALAGRPSPVVPTRVAGVKITTPPSPRSHAGAAAVPSLAGIVSELERTLDRLPLGDGTRADVRRALEEIRTRLGELIRNATPELRARLLDLLRAIEQLESKDRPGQRRRTHAPGTPASPAPTATPSPTPEPTGDTPASESADDGSPVKLPRLGG